MSAKPSRKQKKTIKTTRPLKKHSKTIEKTKTNQKNQGHRRQICYASPCGHISRVSLDPCFFFFFCVFSMVLLWFWTGPLGFFFSVFLVFSMVLLWFGEGGECSHALAHILKILRQNLYKSDLGDLWLIFSRF